MTTLDLISKTSAQIVAELMNSAHAEPTTYECVEPGTAQFVADLMNSVHPKGE